MVIDFKSEDEFENLLHSLVSEIVDANIHWRLHSDLIDQIEKYEKEFNQSPAFWSFTFQAHLDATIFRLIRIFDSHNSSLSLTNLLNTIAANLDLFEIDRFRKRLKENIFVDSLAKNARKPDEPQLRKDVHAVSDGNPVVKKLIIVRNNLLAHKTASNVISGNDVASKYPLTYDDVEELLRLSKVVINRYLNLFKATSYSTQVVGHDDFEFVLDSMRFYLKKLNEDRY